MDWIDLAQAHKCLALVNTVLKFHVTKNVGYIWLSC